MFVLRRLENEDVVIVKKWLEKEYVAKWFGDASGWLYEIEHRKDEFDFINHFIVEESGVPVGFCQYYEWKKAYVEDCEPSRSYGIDYMIGEERFLGRGLGKVVVKLICDQVIEDQPDAIQLLADPTIEEERMNMASIKSLEVNGFQYDKDTGVYKKPLVV